MPRLERLLHGWPAGALTGLGLALVALLGVVDYATGPELSFSIFYLFPIYLVSWLAGRWPGLLLALASAATWLLADLLDPHLYSHPLIPWWNALVRLALFAVTAWLLAELRASQLRRRALERVFFHDILNVAGSIRGFAELLQDDDVQDKQEVYTLLRTAAEQSIDEIEAQRLLAVTQDGELPVRREALHSLALLDGVVALYRSQELARDRQLERDPASADRLLYSDPTLLSRILGNLVKNALEASAPGETVRLGCRTVRNAMEFWVWNRAAIPAALQADIFHRQVSSKRGGGRGLGTFSVRLLAERLGGHASFTSSPEDGTRFSVQIPGEKLGERRKVKGER